MLGFEISADEFIVFDPGVCLGIIRSQRSTATRYQNWINSIKYSRFNAVGKSSVENLQKEVRDHCSLKVINCSVWQYFCILVIRMNPIMSNYYSSSMFCLASFQKSNAETFLFSVPFLCTVKKL